MAKGPGGLEEIDGMKELPPEPEKRRIGFHIDEQRFGS